MMPALIIIAVLLIVGLMVVGMYNNLVRLRIRVEEAFSTIDTDLKRRYDLIPNLVETVKGYASHEKEVFQNVTQARSAAMSATTPAGKLEAENMLSSTLKSLFAVSEAYPDLKADQNFMQLQQTLESLEKDISVTRVRYNNAVKDFNTARETFPGNLFAGMFGFSAKEFFEVSAPEERENVKVKF